jgi:hypothetical protein
MDNGQKKIRVEMRREMMGGAYANTLRITHTPEEFILDFVMIVPPSGDVTARVITSPGHMKRIAAAIQENIKLYEKKYGAINPATEPEHDRHIGFKPET